jgi:bifunctional ADP-heptose synthase (sugar kinase/adenylyltransferase)
MVDGGFDPIHDGHVRYIAAAAKLGAPILCNVSPDAWVVRKHVPLLTQQQRATVLDAFRDVAYVHLSTGTTVSVLEALRPRFYVKGMDWMARGVPAAEQRVCAEHGIEIVYVDTVVNSSSQIVRDFVDRLAVKA